MNKIIFTIIISILSQVALAQSCPEKLAALQQKVYSSYQVQKNRQNLNRILSYVSNEETQKVLSLSKKFKETMQNDPNNLEELMVLQNETRILVRQLTPRAGFPTLNPEKNSPYDALIAEISDEQGNLNYGIEVRSLLIRQNPMPHLTFWFYRQNAAHNPWSLITLGIMSDQADDYASWRNAQGQRMSGSMKDFLKSQMPAECQ